MRRDSDAQKIIEQAAHEKARRDAELLKKYSPERPEAKLKETGSPERPSACRSLFNSGVILFEPMPDTAAAATQSAAALRAQQELAARQAELLKTYGMGK